MTTNDRRLIEALSRGLPRDLRPYAAVARAAGLTEQEVIDRLAAMKADGRLRRLAAVVDQRQVGLHGNIMVTWNVPDARVEEVGTALASRPEVTHAYERPRGPDWPYNLYTMVHAEDEPRARALVDSWARDLRIDDYRLLVTVREWKKSPPVYFAGPDDEED